MTCASTIPLRFDRDATILMKLAIQVASGELRHANLDKKLEQIVERIDEAIYEADRDAERELHRPKECPQPDLI